MIAKMHLKQTFLFQIVNAGLKVQRLGAESAGLKVQRS
jgi:hypothetical protein